MIIDLSVKSLNSLNETDNIANDLEEGGKKGT